MSGKHLFPLPLLTLSLERMRKKVQSVPGLLKDEGSVRKYRPEREKANITLTQGSTGFQVFQGLGR